MITEIENKRSPNRGGFIERVLGGHPTALQKIAFVLMALGLLLWPLGLFMSIFIFDSSIHSNIDGISRWGIALTIWLYPIYLLPMARLFFRISNRLKCSILFCLCPLVPIAVLVFFTALATSEYAEMKPFGYDPATYKKLNEDYALDINHVYYKYEILDYADPASFKFLDDEYAIDAHHVWYKGSSIFEADPATFEVMSRNSYESRARDKNDFYVYDTPLHVEDVKTFVFKGDNWGIDSMNVYYISVYGPTENKTTPIGDYSTFRSINKHYAADSKYVYYEAKVIEGADPKTFTVIKGESQYGQDKNHVYYGAKASCIKNLSSLRHKNMEEGLCQAFHTDGRTVYNSELEAMPAGTDFKTIHCVEQYKDWYADAKRVYYRNGVLCGANPHTFKIFHSHYVNEDYISDNNLNDEYSYDGKRGYYRDSLMLDIDIATFKCGYDIVDSMSFAFDKNRYYQGKPNSRLERLRQGKCKVYHE